MTGPPPATAAVRVAVRRALAGVTGPVAAAVSGGADSLALAAALAFERSGADALVVDHGLQAGSAVVAERAAEQCRALGLRASVLTPPSVIDGTLPAPERPSRAASCRERSVDHGGQRGQRGQRGEGGPEARARAARYALLDTYDGIVLLGHTRDDQAETVLLGLARGSGARSLAGMPAQRGRFRRPLLGLDRATTRRACAEAGLTPWEDPHNADPAYARVRVRATALPALEAALGPGVAGALARSADQLREDADALDALTPDLPDQPSCADLAVLLPALRARALKRWAERVSGRAVTTAHVDALRALVDDWHGQGPVALPGAVLVRRTSSSLVASGHGCEVAAAEP
jgi:tRNA(Ile)-lysidine synthase